MANYPTSDPSFTTKQNGAGNTIQAEHINSLQDEVVAIGSALRGTLQHGLSIATGGGLSVAGDSTLAGLRIGGPLRLAVQLSTLSGGSTRFDNVAVASTAAVVMLSGNSTTIAISGISGGTHGRTLWLVNTMSGNDITLLTANANSSADCQIALPSNSDKTFQASGSIQLVYSTHTNVWYGLVSRA